ncbi:antitoxin [Xenorhabdus budapestensis]|uniref:Antitoxin n=1 Tax=Xenorhabdus budapestensis TaxID=290110 RepID=A0A2D0IT92_XENBU|nr:antitoxin [Xenorhabdus budapestensis]
MPQIILSRRVVSVSEFRKNPIECVSSGNGESLAIMNRNEPVFYCIPAKEYGELLQLVEDMKSKLNEDVIG